MNNPEFARGDGGTHIYDHAGISGTPERGLWDSARIVGGKNFEGRARSATPRVATITSKDLEHS